MSGPFINLPVATITFAEDDPATLIVPAAIVLEAGGSLTELDVSITAPSVDDVLDVEQDAGPNEISLDTNNHEVLYNGVTIGTYTHASDSQFSFTFNNAVTDAAVQKLVQRITFFDGSQTPDTTDRTVHFLLTDSGAETAQTDATIHVLSVNDAPALHQQYTSTFADSGTGPYSLNIAAPTDADGDTLTVTIDSVPTYGIVEYDDGSGFVQLLGGETGLTADQLATLRYTPDGTGEHGGGSVKYSVTDGTDTVHGQIDIHDVGEEEGALGGLPSAVFSAQSPGTANPPEFYFLPSFGGPPGTIVPDAFGANAGEDGGYFHFNGELLYLADFDDGSSITLDQLMTFDDLNGPLPVTGVTGIQLQNAHFTTFGGNLYFAGDAGGGPNQLIKLAPDLTASTIVLRAGHTGFATDDVGGFTEMGGSLYFAAMSDLNSNATQNPDIIKLDLDGTITPISTRSNPTTGSIAGIDGGIFAFGNSIYFNAYDDVQGLTLFRLDAGSLTPATVDDGSHFNHTFGINSAFHIFGGNLYFNEQGIGGDTLFEMDGAGNTTPLNYLGAALENAGTNGYGDFNGSLYFSAHTGATGTDLFKLDAGGTVTAVDINPGAGDSNAGEWGGFVQFAGALYFFADDPNNFGAETLFRMDAGGIAAPVLAESSSASGTSLFSTGEDAHFTLFGDTLLLRASTADGDELVEVLPDGTAFVDDINDDPAGNSFPGQNGGFGIQGLTQLIGTNGNDILVGCTELDSLNGGPGDDLLMGRHLNDILTGGDGADIFKFSSLGGSDFDLVTDYTLIAGDRVDLTDLLTNFDPGNGDVIGDYVLTARFQTGLLVFVDEDGTGPASPDDWDVAAFLEGVTGGVSIITPSGDVTITPEPSPTVLLSGGTPTATEQVALVLDNGMTVGDDSGILVGADVFITDATFAGSEDTFTVDTVLLATTNITAHYLSGELVLDGLDTVANYQAVLRTVSYLNTSDTPDTSDRAIEITVNDGFADSNVATETIHVQAVNDSAVAQDDDVSTPEDTILTGLSVFDDNGNGPDDPDGGGPAFSVTAVNGVGAAVGSLITLASGAKLTLNANGTFSYNPNGAFDSLHLASPSSGAANTHAADSFTYTITGNTTATVSVTIDGVDNANTIYQGSSGDDTITGDLTLGHLYHLEQGGNDTVTGGNGNDGFYFGGAFNGNDHIDGGAGTNDQLGLEGDYSGGVTLDGTAVTGIEALAMLGGFNYKISTLDNFVGAGQTFTFWSASMGSANHVDIDGHLESNGSFKFFLGQGNDTAKGGAAGNLFYGEGGSDSLYGGAGVDTFAYLAVSDSTGNNLDHINLFAEGIDKFKLPVAVTGIDNAVTGAGSTPDDAALTNIGAGQLAAHHAVVLTVTSGDMTGHVFLAVDANGVAGYQSGQDFLFDMLAATNLSNLSTSDFI